MGTVSVDTDHVDDGGTGRGWRRFRLADLPAEPWRNGGGDTRTVAARADTAGGLLWRVSVADVTRDGPFSVFPDTDRQSALLAGAGLTLRGAGVSMRLEAPGAVTDYPGDAAWHAELHDGPARLWNAMTRRSRARARTECVDDRPVRLDGATTVLVVLDGTWTLRAPGPPSLTLRPGEGLVMEDAGTERVLRPERGGARLLCTRIDAPA